jgi:signal transduction histidine kinase
MRPQAEPARAPALLVATAMAAICGLVATWLRYGFGSLPVATPHLVAGWVAAGSGIFAWWRVPWSRVGPLWLAAGIAWFATDISGCLNLEPFTHRCVSTGPVAPIASATASVWLGIVCHLLTTFPSGRIASRAQAAIVIGGYAIALAIPLWAPVATLAAGGFLITGPLLTLRHSASDARPDVLPALVIGTGLAVALGVAELVPEFVIEIAVPLAAIGTVVGLMGVADRRAALSPDRAVELGGALATALRDPRFSVAFRSSRRDAWVDSAGQRVPTPVAADGAELTTIERDGETLAIAAHDPATLNDPNVRAAVTLALELAAHNARLRADLAEQLAELEASRLRLVDAALRERRELGDRVDEEVLSPLAHLSTELDQIGSVGDEPTETHVKRASDQLATARQEIGALASGLYPRMLESDGLAATLRDLVSRSSVPVEIRTTLDGTGRRAVDATIYFVCSEALTNVERHAGATSVRLTLTATGSAVELVIEDDGVGGADAIRGSGLRGLADRVEALGGSLLIESAAGKGTRLVATIPVNPEAR